MINLSSVFKAAKSRMAEIEHDSTSEQFRSVFKMEEGDYLELRKPGTSWCPCRILAVQEVYRNSANGYTAILLVARRLASGSMGVGRTITLSVDFAGKGLRVLGYTWKHVRRV